MNLLPKSALIKTSSVDHADWNYDPVLKYPSRARFRLILDLMGPGRVQRLLELGYGSGIFLPELASRCDELYGIDIHNQTTSVQENLWKHRVSASLSMQDAARTYFPDEFFGIIVAVSALEFVEDIESAACELARILAPAGRLLAVMPRSVPALDSALRLLTGEDPTRDYANRRERVLPALECQFRVVGKRTTPVYFAYEFRRLST